MHGAGCAAAGFIYPCVRSRKDVAQAAIAPHEGGSRFSGRMAMRRLRRNKIPEPEGRNWRFRVPDGEVIEAFVMEIAVMSRGRRCGISVISLFGIGRTFRAYELAVVVDDLAMGVTEIVRGDDLLTSTARQILIYRALDAAPPAFFHCPLVLETKRTPPGEA